LAYFHIQPSAGYYTLYPRNADNSNTPPAQSTGSAGSAAQASGSSTSTKPKQQNLISRYHLEKRVSDNEAVNQDEVGGKAAWEDSAEKREASLQERKAKMILAARQYVSSRHAINIQSNPIHQTNVSTASPTAGKQIILAIEFFFSSFMVLRFASLFS
jgi:hypothetical protein